MKEKVGTIDLTPTWRSLVPMFIMALQSGTPTGQQMAKEQIEIMANIADEYNELVKASKSE